MSDNEDKLIDEIDLALFRILRRAHDLRTTKKTTELINAIRHARCLSYRLLPAAKRRLMSEKDFDRVIQTLHLFKKWITYPEGETWTDGTFFRKN